MEKVGTDDEDAVSINDKKSQRSLNQVRKGSFSRVKSFVKFGLCPENDIDEFEASYQGIKFVDPFFHPQQIRAILSSKGVSI
jgi:hypothetical protein